MISFVNQGRTRPLKVLVIASSYPRNESDYAVPWFRESLRQLTQLGHQVTVLAPSYQGLADHQVDDVWVKRFRYAPKAIEKLTHEQGAPNRIRNPLFQLLAIPYVIMGCLAAKRLAAKENFDVIHVHWPFPHFPIAKAAASVCKAPIVATCHGAEFALARRKQWVAPLLGRYLKNCDHVIANSTDTARHIRELSGVEAEVIPFGSTVEPKHAVVNRSCSKARVLFTGRLIQRKGVEYLIRAVPLILEKKPDVEFIITGSGDQREKLETLTNELNLGHAIRFLGFVTTERLNDEYASCHVWVNPSIVDDRGDTEGLGVGAMEAYAHGKPVVCSAVGGIPDAVENGVTGWLVPEKDPAALAHAIVDLLQDPAKADQFGQAGLRMAQRKFNWQTLTAEIESVYARLLSEPTDTRSFETMDDTIELSEFHELLDSASELEPTPVGVTT
ncbi:MAG: glycosyltransferase family 4 protein [Planctomycetales bacterium]|nr:glycosyltransferase family 4 protein [Planctomycetales bacterium]